MTHERLTEIFRKVGSKELTREGLNDLYDFKQEFPDADLTPYLSKTSQFFQRYIEQGLKNIALERERVDKERIEKQARVAAAGGTLKFELGLAEYSLLEIFICRFCQLRITIVLSVNNSKLF